MHFPVTIFIWNVNGYCLILISIYFIRLYLCVIRKEFLCVSGNIAHFIWSAWKHGWVIQIIKILHYVLLFKLQQGGEGCWRGWLSPFLSLIKIPFELSDATDQSTFCQFLFEYSGKKLVCAQRHPFSLHDNVLTTNAIYWDFICLVIQVCLREMQ